MSYITINDFKLGLDARKMALALPPGALVECDNAHITPGGEVEKRKAFTAADLPAGTFGLQEIPAGLLIFGSVATVTGLPSGVSYQRLQHPAVLAGTTPTSDHNMTEIISTCLFGNDAFAVAKFGDGGVYCYYKGALVADYVAGVILAYLDTDAKIAANIVSLLADTAGYADSTQVGNTEVLNILGQPGVTYSTQTTSSGAGTLTPQIKDAGLAATPGAQAAGQFQIMAGSLGGSNYVASVKIYSGTTLIAQLLFDYNVPAGSQTATSAGTLVSFGADANSTAIAIASAISQKAAITGFYAVASSNIISVVAVAPGTTANAYKLEVTASGNVCIGNCVIAFSGTNAGITSIVAGSTTICGSVAMGADIPATVAAAAATVISTTGGTWCAFSVGSTLYLSKAVTTSSDPDVTITVTCGAGLTTSDAATSGWTAAATDLVFSAKLYYSASKVFQQIIVSNCTVGSGFIIISAANSTVINGTAKPPYTYLWSFVGGSNNFSIVNATAANVQVKHSVTTNVSTVPANATYTATLQCVVTDSTGATAYTITGVKVSFSVSWLYA